MPRIKLTKSAIDARPTPSSDVVYFDAASPGFGVKVTPKGRLTKEDYAALDRAFPPPTEATPLAML